MPSLFTAPIGGVSVVDEGTPGCIEFQPHLASFAGGAEFRIANAIVTNTSLRERERVQFSYSLANTIWVYFFGREVSTIEIAGVTFDQGCDGPAFGSDTLLTEYQAMAPSGAIGFTVIAGVGRLLRYAGFAIGLDLRTARTDESIMGFSIQIAGVPIADI